jgi:hypothetical protein
MLSTSKVFAALLAGILVTGTVACSERESNRWVTTENTNVKLDWDKVNQAYKDANGPEDLEKRINEIYEGDEIISVSVQDSDAKNQIVTGFFDKNSSGAVDEGEKIFTIRRTVTGEGQGELQTTGYGPYYGYHSPLMSIATGMLLGSMISGAFSPRYVPVYTTPYTTTASRAGTLGASRSSYRAANPAKFSKPSRTGRTYGGTGSTGRSGGFRGGGGGGRFGLARRGRTARPSRLTD